MFRSKLSTFNFRCSLSSKSNSGVPFQGERVIACLPEGVALGYDGAALRAASRPLET